MHLCKSRLRRVLCARHSHTRIQRGWFGPTDRHQGERPLKRFRRADAPNTCHFFPFTPQKQTISDFPAATASQLMQQTLGARDECGGKDGNTFGINLGGLHSILSEWMGMLYPFTLHKSSGRASNRVHAARKSSELWRDRLVSWLQRMHFFSLRLSPAPIYVLLCAASGPLLIRTLRICATTLHRAPVYWFLLHHSMKTPRIQWPLP